MARKASRKAQGISPAGKVAILLAVFGVPALFFASSWGLSQLFELAPMYIVIALGIFAMIYTAYTAKLMFDFYELQAPILRFVPCICETTLIDVKWHLPCYILYALAVLAGVASQLPYSVLKVFGDTVALNAGFYCTVLAIIFLIGVQIIKGIGLMGTIKDVGAEWYQQTHADMGAISKLAFLGFIPFVRVIALYSLNKPLSTMVSFMEVTVNDTDDGDGFEAEDE